MEVMFQKIMFIVEEIILSDVNLFLLISILFFS